MSRHNLDPKTISVFDTISSYFIDVFYNNHFSLARDLLRQGKAPSITDAYRKIVQDYMSGIAQRADLYTVAAKKLHAYYQSVNNYGSIQLCDFEDRVLVQFIPGEYYRSFTAAQKDSALRKIIIHLVQSLGTAILQPDTFKEIIDDHQNGRNVTFLQDYMVDNLAMLRDTYHAKFTKQIAQSNAPDGIGKEAVTALKKAYVAEKKKLCETQAELERAKEIIKQLYAKLTSVTKTAEELRARVAELEDDDGQTEAEAQREAMLKNLANIKRTQDTPPADATPDDIDADPWLM